MISKAYKYSDFGLNLSIINATKENRGKTKSSTNMGIHKISKTAPTTAN